MLSKIMIVVGIDFDDDKIEQHLLLQRRVLHGDPSDADFWDRIIQDHEIELVMLTLPNLESNLSALARLREIYFSGRIAATAKYQDDAQRLREAGATAVFNIYTEAGTGFANHVETQQ
jgi:glutathione-regulated potassium-efflux system ancillary protein KefC